MGRKLRCLGALAALLLCSPAQGQEIRFSGPILPGAGGGLFGIDVPADEECLTFEATGGVFQWENCDAWGTFDTPAGTDPVADQRGDTVQFLAGAGVTITGDAALDTITFVNTGATASFVTWTPPSGDPIVADSATDTATITATGGGMAITGTALTDTIDFDTTNLLRTDADDTFSDTTWEVTANTVDGADTKYVALNGGGATQDEARGAYIILPGNEVGSNAAFSGTKRANPDITNVFAYSTGTTPGTINMVGSTTAGTSSRVTVGGDLTFEMTVGNGSGRELFLNTGADLVFEGFTSDAFETSLTPVDPTADRTINIPNASGTIAVSATSPITLSAAGDIGCATCTTSSSELWINTSNTYPRNAEAVHITAGTDTAETLANAGYDDGAGDIFVQSNLGVEGNAYTDGAWIVGATTTLSDGSLTWSGNNFVFRATTSDAADTSQVEITAGGAVESPGRGASLYLGGNELAGGYAAAGEIFGESGTAAGAEVEFYARGATTTDVLLTADVGADGLAHSIFSINEDAFDYSAAFLGASTEPIHFGAGKTIRLEGATDNTFETTLTLTDPTADRTITLPNADGTVAVSASSPLALSAAGDLSCSTCVTTSTELWQVGANGTFEGDAAVIVGADAAFDTTFGASGVGDLKVADDFQVTGNNVWLAFAGTSAIAAATADAADNQEVAVCGGGAATTSRGAFLLVEGNEEAGGGDASLRSGSGVNASAELEANGETSTTARLDAELTTAGNQALFNVIDDSGTYAWEFTGPTTDDIYIGDGVDLVFEGPTDNTFETILTPVDTTVADKTINIPNASGTVAVSATSPITLSALGDIGCATCATTSQLFWSEGANAPYTSTNDGYHVTPGTDIAETISDAAYNDGGGDLFVSDQLGVETAIFTDGTLTVVSKATVGSLQIGANGTTIDDSYAGSAVIDFASTSATTLDSSGITVTGAALGDTCTVGTDLAATWVTGADFSCYVSATDTVIVRFSAHGAAINPGSDTFRVRTFDP